ncbi:hypothetical protein M1L59_06420 [Acinetobacter schindleri]|uniref:hypothetical protein n=1 Tax=Acinetobacter schindleri TaxID=108981 RepID=UPI00200A4E32|nr:hypothetical protein [Acinetobacter schindleri]MCK8640346.1 hypothetical protein [Acinetobacter schindleri]
MSSVLVLMLAVCTMIFMQTHAATLKKSCLKAYPLAAEDTDPEILQQYAQLCTKPARKDLNLQHEIKAHIAQLYLDRGQHLKALQTVDQLSRDNYTTRQLTDISFLAGVAISNHAVNYMRTTEIRPLTEETYTITKVFNDNVRLSQPVTVMPLRAEKSSSSKKKTVTTASKKNSSAKTRINAPVRSQTKETSSRNIVAKKIEPVVLPNVQSSSNPFGALRSN